MLSGSMPQTLIDRLAQVCVHRVEVGVQGRVEFHHGGKALGRIKVENLDVPLIVGQALGARIVIGTQRQLMHRQTGLIARHSRHDLAGKAKRALGFAGLQQNAGQANPGRQIVRLQRQGFFVSGDRGIELAQTRIGHRAVLRSGALRRQRGDLRETRARLLQMLGVDEKTGL